MALTKEVKYYYICYSYTIGPGHRYSIAGEVIDMHPFDYLKGPIQKWGGSWLHEAVLTSWQQISEEEYLNFQK